MSRNISRQEALRLISYDGFLTNSPRHWFVTLVADELKRVPKEKRGLSPKFPSNIDEILADKSFYPFVLAALISSVEESKNYNVEDDKRSFAGRSDGLSPEDFTPEFMAAVALALYS